MSGSFWPTALLGLVAACSASRSSRPDGSPTDCGVSCIFDAAVGDALPLNPKRGVPFPPGSPWVSFYGSQTQMGDLTMAASTFRLINIDADTDQTGFMAQAIKTLQAGGANRVISYLNIGSCEDNRSYWTTVPSAFVPCGMNQAAQLSTYAGYSHEVWMDPSNVDYQNLIVGYLAPRLAALGVDGFFLDNMEVVENTFTQGAVSGNPSTPRGCDGTCPQGGLDLVKRLRDAFPDKLIIMQNATSDVTRLGTTGGVAFPSLLDGISHEDVYDPPADPTVLPQLAAWKAMGLTLNGQPFWISTEDYGGSKGACPAATFAQPIYDAARADGYSPYVTDDSAGQQLVCYWPF